MTDFFIRSLQNAKHNAMPEITKSRDDGSGTGIIKRYGPPAMGRIVTIPPGPTLSVFTIIESAYSSAPAYFHHCRGRRGRIEVFHLQNAADYRSIARITNVLCQGPCAGAVFDEMPTAPVPLPIVPATSPFPSP